MNVICTNCYNINVDGANFCKKCGVPIIQKPISGINNQHKIESYPGCKYRCPFCNEHYELKVNELKKGLFICPVCKKYVKIKIEKLLIIRKSKEPQIAIPNKITELSVIADNSIVSFLKCKICKKGFSLDEELIRCLNCNTLYHKLCYEDNSGCNNPNCNSNFKFCQNCKEPVKKEALKCKHCGSYVDQRFNAAGNKRVELKEASTALTIAIISIFCAGFILGPIAIYIGNKALNEIKENPNYFTGEGKANTAIIIGIIITLLNLLYFFAILLFKY